ncbi:MAG: hypothetical protein LBK99_21290 [Opitutaceae bacterium]|jgi:hypothetical protein|nr:hypothetical protein [Opitutaceae bacterium]
MRTRILLAVLALALGVGGCTSTITPDPVPAAAASWDGGEQNSGIVVELVDGYVITGQARARYNRLVGLYGPAEYPGMVADFGVTPYAEGRWFMNRQAAARWHYLAALERMGAAKK